MLIEYLEKYLKLTEQMLTLKSIKQMDTFERVLKERASVIKRIQQLDQKDENEETVRLLNQIKDAEQALEAQVTSQMNLVEDKLNAVKQERLVHGKNKLALNKFKQSNLHTSGYYFDRKK